MKPYQTPSLHLLRTIILTLTMPSGWILPAYAKETHRQYSSVPGEFVVKIKHTPDAKSLNTFEEIARRLKQVSGLKSDVQVRHFKTSDRFAVIQAPGLKSARELLQSDDRVEYAEPNYLYHAIGFKADAAPANDSKFSQLWGLQNVGQVDAAGQPGKSGSDIHVVPVWNEGITGSKRVKVAVIDTGIEYTHPDLQANIMKNEAEIAADGIDNDNNGFIDDVYGWNFNQNIANGMDDHNHGTHCAGTIGGVGNNGFGVVGVNWNVSILPVKFLSAQGSGSLDAAMQSIQYATLMGVDIMSNSWGGGPYSQALFDVIEESKRQGILFVAAAGNESNDNDASASYPASYAIDNVLAVAATDNRDQIANFSNYGRTKVHVAAPGVKILSTVRNSDYAVYSGTSMATPHVSGIAALMKAANPSYTYQQIKQTLIDTSDKVRSLSRKVVARGRVNVYNAIHGIVPVDQSPTESQWKDHAWTAESPHPYVENKTYTFNFDVPNAKYVRVVFEYIETEAGYDKILIKDSNNEEIENLSGTYAAGYTSDYISGSKGTITLKTDSSMNKKGFKVAKLQVIY
jgi:thermitase